MEPFFSIQINGTSKGFFKAIRGLQQGDPLSPFLFSLVADGLSVILRKAEEASLLEGFIIGNDRVMVTHLQFTDDTILFLKAELDNIKSANMCLKIFQTISSLKVNLFKISVMGIEVEESFLANFATVLGCSVGSWPVKYLGIPLGGNPKSVALWDPVVEKVSKKLASWKRSYIFVGGRITLIKAALSNIPVYYMFMYRMPRKVIQVTEKY